MDAHNHDRHISQLQTSTMIPSQLLFRLALALQQSRQDLCRSLSLSWPPWKAFRLPAVARLASLSIVFPFPRIRLPRNRPILSQMTDMCSFTLLILRRVDSISGLIFCVMPQRWGSWEPPLMYPKAGQLSRKAVCRGGLRRHSLR